MTSHDSPGPVSSGPVSPEAIPSDPGAKRRPKGLLLWVLGAIFLAYVGVNTIMFVVALQTHPDLVTPDYYERGKKVNEARAIREESRTLGWKVRMIPPASGGRELALWITGADGAALSGLAGSVRAYRPSDARLDQTLSLAESPSQPGLYSAGFSAPSPGLWQVTVSLIRGGDRFSETLRYIAK